MRGHTGILAASVAALAVIAPVQAETLRDALAKAYRFNPTLTGARAEQRANDENVPIQRSYGLPNANATGSFSDYVVSPGDAFSVPGRSIGGTVTLNVPIYQGGLVRNSVRAAEKRVQAGADSLRGTESSVFSQVVAAYNDVIRDASIVDLNRANVNALTVNLQATRDRFEVGDLTRTDVAQSDARLAVAQSDLRTAESNLISSRERYVALVGDVPGDLQPPPPLPNLPNSPDAAVAVAVRNNPDLAAAERSREAARYDIGAAASSRLPRLSGVAQGGYTNYLGTLQTGVPGVSFPQTNKQVTVGLSASLPLFQGGRPAAQVRQAQARESQALENSIAVERSVIEQARAAYAAWQSSLAVIQSAQTTVSADQLALEGVRAENSVGTRTILEILNAEQELLNAQVQLVSARRNAYVAAFALLAAMGQAEARDLNLQGEGVALYDPAKNYRRVRNRIWDFDQDPEPRPVATRTVDTPAQNPATSGPPK